MKTNNSVIRKPAGFPYKFTVRMLFPLLILLVCAGCKNPWMQNILGPPLPYEIGDTGPGGGKIFYKSERGFTMTDNDETCYYLEAAPEDIGEQLMWASQNSSFVDTGTGIGTGRKNTTLILNSLIGNTTAPAASACREYSNNEKTDWFLPSKDELFQLYANRNSVGNLNGTEIYWSSSQFPNNIQFAWSQHFSDGTQNQSNKTTPCLVRAVRAF